MPPTPDAIGINSAAQSWSPRVLYANHSHDARCRRSHCCPNETPDPYDDRLFLILPRPFPTIISAETQLDDAKAEQNYVSNHGEITITILNHDYPATKPRWQLTINMIEKSVKEKRIFKQSEIAVSDQSSPTDKLKARMEAVYQDMHRAVNRNVIQTSYRSTKKSTKILLKPPIKSAPMKSTRWSPKQPSNDKSMPITDDYLLHDTLYRARTELRWR
jgi:hypothetical protein